MRDEKKEKMKFLCPNPDQFNNFSKSALCDNFHNELKLNDEKNNTIQDPINIDDFTAAEQRFLADKGINTLNTRWEWVYLYPTLVYDFYNDVIYAYYDRVPTQNEIIQMGYHGFLNALYKIGLSINDLIKNFGHVPNQEILYSEKSYAELVELFKKEIYPTLKNIYLLKDGIPPLYEHLEENYRGFLNQLSMLGSILNDLIKSAGLIPRKDTIYNDFSFQDFVDFFEKRIYPVLKQKLSLNDGEAPTTYQIRRCFSGYMEKLYKNHYSINDIFTKLGLRLNYELYYNRLSYFELKMLFINDILPNIQERLNLDLMTSYSELASMYSGFIEALGRFSKTYNQFPLDLGFEPRILQESVLGRLRHTILKYLISSCINNGLHKCCYYSESAIFMGARFTIDGLICVDNNYLSELNLSFAKSNDYINNDQNLHILNFLSIYIPKLSYLLFDYSAGFVNVNDILNLELISRKILKYRNIINSFLFLVSTNWYSSDLFHSLPTTIENKGNTVNTNNVLLISPSLFSFIIGLNFKEIEILKQIMCCNDLFKLNQILQSLKNNKNIRILTKNNLFLLNGDRNLDNWL